MEQKHSQLSNEFTELIHNALKILENETGLEKNAAYVDRYHSMKAELEALEQAYQSNQIDKTLPCLYVVKLLGLYDSLELLDAVGALNCYYRKHFWILKKTETLPDRFINLINYAIAVVEEEMGEQRNAIFLPRYNGLIKSLENILQAYKNNRLYRRYISLDVVNMIEEHLDSKHLIEVVCAVNNYYRRRIYRERKPEPSSVAFVNLIREALNVVGRELAISKNETLADRYCELKKELEVIESGYKSRTLNCRSVQLCIVRLLDSGDSQELQEVVGAVNRYYQYYLSEAE